MGYKTIEGLDAKFSAADMENRCMDFWEKEEVYRYDSRAAREDTYVVDTPPPTVSGSLHIGHIFSYTQTDALVRFHRMRGKSVFYPIGWDDNGLPTERRVQNYYNIVCNPDIPYDPDFVPVHDPKDKSPRKEVSRHNFIQACEILTHEDEKVFEGIFKRIGHSYDWSLKYSTIDSRSMALSQLSFLKLAADGKARSVEAPTMWDVTFRSAIAQAEVEDREIEGFFHKIRFKVREDGSEFVVATTRPELLGACIAVVAHPDDGRYRHLFGKTAIVPLFDAPVPIMISEHADKEKGTGIMMVCTFGDIADVAWWKRSGMPIKQLIGPDGRFMNIRYGTDPFETLDAEKARAGYSRLCGKTVKQARDETAALLHAEGVLLGDPEKVLHSVKFFEKGTLPLEFVSSRQWFVGLLDEKTRLLELGRQIKWKPEYMLSRYENWVEGLNQDWCVSRQRFFGVPFPVWYRLDEQGNADYANPLFASEEALPVDPASDVPGGYAESQRNVPGGFTGDRDVMDTWATSSLTPQIALAHAPVEPALSLPFDVRPQAHDIIRTWAFYTIAKAMLHENTIPWKEALISGFILDPDRKKMSKSKGNVVTPVDLIDRHSADAVRYWAARAKLGVDTAYEEQVMEQGRRLAIKIFNAGKFVIGLPGVEADADCFKTVANEVDRSWLYRLKSSVLQATEAFERNDYSEALEAAERCFWDFCDNYIETVKGRVYGDSPDRSAVGALMVSIGTFARLFAPFCPFVAEEVYQACRWKMPGDAVSVHAAEWPVAESFDGAAADNGLLYDALVRIGSEIRKAKTMAGVSLKTPVDGVEITAPGELLESLKNARKDIENVGCLAEGAVVFLPGRELSVEKILLGGKTDEGKNNGSIRTK